LSGVKDVRCHGRVPTGARTAHPGLHPRPGQELPITLRAILAATIGMHHEACGGSPGYVTIAGVRRTLRRCWR